MKELTQKSLELAGEKLSRLLRESHEVGLLKGQLMVREQRLEALIKELDPQIQREFEYVRKDMSLKAKIAMVLGEPKRNHPDRQKEWLSAGEILNEIQMRYGQKYGGTSARKYLTENEGELFERKGEGKGTKWRYIGKEHPVKLFEQDIGFSANELEN